MRRLKNSSIVEWLVLLVLVACIGMFAGCGGGGSRGDDKGQSQSEGEPSGTVAAQLFFIPDQPEGLKTLAYEISGTGSERMTGTVEISSNPVSATVPDVPAGTGLTMQLTTADGACAGQATFDVLAGQTTTVQIPVLNRSVSAADWAASAETTSSASTPSSYVDDGRYDYYLSQPNANYTVTVDKNVDITMRDGKKLKGDVYRPGAPGRFPVIMAQSPYPRWLVGMGGGVGIDDNGGVGTKYQSFEEANPEYWIPRGYIYIRVSTRGYGGSEGQTATLDAQEYYDYYDMIEWAAGQPWSNGNIGLFGISYFAFSQYYVAGLKPPHLKAIVPWEGLADPYRDIGYRGGIPCVFSYGFAAGMQLLANNPFTAVNYFGLFLKYPLFDKVWEYGVGYLANPEANTIRVLDILNEIDVPMLSVGNLNDPDLHLRGNVYAFQAARSPIKKLLLYTGTHWGSAYQPWANRTVLRFLDHWLKGNDTGIYNEPAVDVQLRTGSGTYRHVYGDAWPLPQTLWTKYYLDAGAKTLSTNAPLTKNSAVAQHVSESGIGSSDQLTFRTAPLAQDVAIAGPVSAHFWVSSSTRDVDLTVELRDFDAQGKEKRFAYYIAGNPDEPVSRGWLKVSLRALDPERTREHQPFHLFSRNDWLTPGVPVPVDVEIWPTSMLFKAGHRITLTIHCGPYTRAGEAGFLAMGSFAPAFLTKMKVPVYQSFSSSSGTTKIYTGGVHASWLDLPVIPADTGTVHQITVGDGNFTPALVTANMGERFEWTNTGTDYHSATESSGLNLWDSQLINGSRSHNPATWGITIAWAGTFNYRDMVSGFSGAIAVPVQVPQSVSAGGNATMVLGTKNPPAGKGFDVQLQAGDGAWSNIATGVSATQITTATLAAGTYNVRARLRSLDAAKPGESDWSPPATFTVK